MQLQYIRTYCVHSWAQRAVSVREVWDRQENATLPHKSVLCYEKLHKSSDSRECSTHKWNKICMLEIFKGRGFLVDPGVNGRIILILSEFYTPTFRNNLFHIHWCFFLAFTAYEDGTDRVFRNFCAKNSEARKSPKRKNTTFRTRLKFEIQKNIFVDWVSLVRNAHQSRAVVKTGMKISA
jgi:hypothetical protein